MKEKRKNKLKQSIISVIIILVALLAGNIVAEDKIQENTNETVQTNTENNSNINIEEIPQYSGTTVITINNDISKKKILVQQTLSIIQILMN